MPSPKKVSFERNGRIWTLSKVRLEDAEEEDFRFWFEDLTPEQRIEAVYDALEVCLKMKGVDAVPRLRRIHRLIKRSPGKVPRRRSSGPRLPRSAARN